MGPPTHTRIDPKHGQVTAESPAALKSAGNEALNAGDNVRASHMYTVGLDLALAGRSADDLSAADWFALDASSDGVVSALLSNRSLALLNQADHVGAADDAEHCCLAKPDWAKGHLRLQAALEAGKAPDDEVLAALRRGLRACPTSHQLKEALAKTEAQQELDAMAERGAAHAAGKRPAAASPTSVMGAEAAAELEVAAQVAATRRAADDATDPRRFVAAGDLGAALALGAHGLDKDVVAAERYLKVGAEGGDVVSMRNLGHLLLSESRPGEAAEAFGRAAKRGDQESVGLLRGLNEEASSRAGEAREQLEKLAAVGNAQALQMLEQLRTTEVGVVV